MKNKIKNGLFIFFFIILLLPVWQQCFPFITSGQLYGFATYAPPASFSLQKWWECSYQGPKGDYLNDNMGFRPDLIRLNNQLEFSLFGTTHCKWKVVLGKDHCVFQENYIYSYNGEDFMGYAAILNKLQKVKAIQDTLSRLGKSLIVVHAPCKAFYYPEDIPEKYKKEHRNVNNFETFLRIGDSLGINQLDFNTWFVSMKNKSKDVLYTKQGVHWSVYGSYIAADSLVSYMEKLRNIRMPHPVWTKTVRTEKPRESDDDLARTFNLIWPYTTETFSYPEVSYSEDVTTTKPSVIYLGDSFLEAWINDGLMEHTDTNWQVIWNLELTMDKHTSKEQVAQTWATYDLAAEMNNRDCLVLMYTSRDLTRFGDGFIEKAYHHYFPKSEISNEQ